MLAHWKRKIVRIEGSPEKVIYFDPQSKPPKAVDDEFATRRFIATKDGLLLHLDNFTLSSFADMTAFQDMLLSACHASHLLAERKGARIRSFGEARISVTASSSTIELQANQVELQSLPDLLGILRPIWAAWLEVDRRRGGSE